ncbi:MAG: hypothetical protein KDN05_17405, partial [Verrucomicrobiae bacterium]|nr:hypothetical protein [Verrucomicrobiae bacterium]
MPDGASPRRMRETNGSGGTAVAASTTLDKQPLSSMLGAMERWIRWFCAFFTLLVAAIPAVASQQVVTRIWQSQDGLPGNVVRSLVQSSDGYLWVATAEGIARFDGFEFQLVTPAGDLRRFRLSFFRVFATSNGDVWAATYQGGLFRVRIDGLEPVLPNISRPQPPLVTQLIDGGTRSVVFRRGDEYGRVSPDGEATTIEPDDLLLGKFNEDLERQRQAGRVVGDDGHPVLTDRRDRTWISDASGGLHVTGLDGEPVRVDFGGRLFTFGVNELHEDREGNIWVASPVNGLARLRPARVETIDVSSSSGDRTFLSVMQDSGGAWWFASRRGGLVRWTPGETQSAEFAATRFHRSIAAVCEDREQRIWAASRDGSVFLRADGRFEPQFTRTQVPSKVRSIVQTLDGTLWFGGSQGLSTVSGETVRRFGP